MTYDSPYRALASRNSAVPVRYRKRNTEPEESPEVHQRLEIDSDSDASSVDENYSVASLTSSIEDQLTWRGRMQIWLHSIWFHLFIVVLVLLDAFTVLFELFLDVGAFGNVKCFGNGFLEEAEYCHFDMNSRNFCEAPAQLILEGLSISNSGDGESGICKCGFLKGEKVCIPTTTNPGTNPAFVLHYFSLFILSIFVLEILLKLVAFRTKFFTHKFEVFDATVVLLSWILDIASLCRDGKRTETRIGMEGICITHSCIPPLKEEEAFEAASLLIILRLWRVIRIVNGAVLSAKSQSDKELQSARSEARNIIHALHKCREKLSTVEGEKKVLIKTLADHSIPVPSNVTKSKPLSYKQVHMEKFLKSQPAPKGEVFENARAEQESGKEKQHPEQEQRSEPEQKAAVEQEQSGGVSRPQPSSREEEGSGSADSKPEGQQPAAGPQDSDTSAGETEVQTESVSLPLED